MIDSKLILLLSTISEENKRKLRKWIKSDFVNKNKDIVTFFEFIDSRKSITKRTVSKEKAHEYLYPNTPYNDLRIRHLIWLTTEIVEEFIVYYSVSQQEVLKKQLLTKYYIDNELFKPANQHIEESITLIEQSTTKGGLYHLNQYQIHALYYQLNSKNNRARDFKLQDVINHITYFTILETLKYACITQSLQKISKIKIDNYLLDTILNLLQNPIFLKNTSIRIYYNIFLVIKDEDEKAFHVFLKDLQQNNNQFSVQDLKELYLLAINFCVKKSNQNIKKYTRHAFELYIYAIQQSYLINNHEISRFSFTNVVTLGIKLKDFTKTESFIQEFADYIAFDFKQNTIDFNKAKVLYAKNKPQEALTILLMNEFKDVLWNLNAKYLVLKILFERRDEKKFSIYLKAFKIYIKRKSNIGYHQTYFQGVSNALTILMKIYKNPEQYKNFIFDKDTPDIDWFKKALKKVIG